MIGELLAVLALCMFSGGTIGAKVASRYLEVGFGFLIVMIVNLGIATLLVGAQFLLSGSYVQWSGVAFLLFALAGFFSTYLGRWFLYDSIVKLGPAKASTFQVSNPLFTVLIARIFLKENLAVYDILAIITMLSGLFLVNLAPEAIASYLRRIPFWREPRLLGKQTVRKEQRVDVLVKLARLDFGLIVRSGAFVALSGALAYAIGNVLRGVAIQDWNEPVLGALIGAVVGLIFHFLFSYKARRIWQWVRTSDRVGLLLYAGCGVLTIFGQIFLIASMYYIPVSIANLITLSTPMLVTPLSYFLLKNEEKITPLTIVGIIMVLSGICTILLV